MEVTQKARLLYEINRNNPQWTPEQVISFYDFILTSEEGLSKEYLSLC